MNKLYAEIDMLRSTVNAQTDAMDAREGVHKQFIRENVQLTDALRSLLLDVLAKESAGRFDGWKNVDMSASVEKAQNALQMVEL
jgi:hypothetical protein